MKAENKLRDEFAAKTTGERPFLTNYAMYLEQKLIEQSHPTAQERYDKAMEYVDTIGGPTARRAAQQAAKIASGLET